MRAHLWITLAAALALSGRGWCELCPPGAEACGGMQDTMLIYLGEGKWTADELRPYVVYLDRTQGGRATDWFYDSFLLMMYGGAPSNGSYFDGTANAEDWRYYLDRLFAGESGLGGLEACAEQARAEIPGEPPVLPVTLMVPYLSTANLTFGDLDGDGTAEDAASDAARLRAFAWLVDECQRRWEAAGYRHLKLWGFYWMMEGVGGPDMGVVQGTAKLVHERGLGFSWIPWFQAPGYERWREAGFDYAIVQPNYAFMPVPVGAPVPDEDRLSQNAADARRLGLGVEMEMHRPDTDPGHRLNLQLYLNHGVDELDGTMRGAVRAYYQSGNTIARLYGSPLASCNRLYDDLYRFHKGTYERRRLSLCEGGSATLNGVAAPGLTDGLWVTRDGQEGRVAVAELPAVVEVDLGAEQTVGECRVHLATDDGALGLPEVVAVETSVDGETYEAAGELDGPRLRPTGRVESGFAMGAFAPRSARHLRIRLSGAIGGRTGVDEVVVYPCANVLGDLTCHAEAEDGVLAPGPTVECLVDGRVGGEGLQASSGRLRVRFEVGAEQCLAAARAHARWPAEGEAPRMRARAVTGQGEDVGEWVALAGDGEGWGEVVVTNARPDSLEYELSGNSDVVWDELTIRPAANLASGKPYTVAPAFGAKYPDAGGRELTDGLLSEEGFGDGRTVGWVSQPVSITVDLGGPMAVDAARVHVQGGGYAWVHAPESMEVATSLDGEHWQRVRGGTETREVVSGHEVGDERAELVWLRVGFAERAAQYLRVSFPAGPWLMVSEVEVVSRGRNAARDARYWTTAPQSDAPYPDDGRKLTDGALTRAGGGWAKCAGWSEGEPVVTVDLMRAQTVGLVRVHCQGGGPAGVWFPTAAWASTSLDGAVWSEEAPMGPVPPEAGGEALASLLEAQMTPSAARYVRIRAERRGWLMLDEVEVYR